MPALWIMPGELTDPTNPHAYEACKAASYVLWAFSGRKYHGLRTVTERYECPCRSSDLPGFNIFPYLDGTGVVRNQMIVDRLSSCGCAGTINGQHTRLRLRGAPVRHVETVLDPSGEEIVKANYKIVNGRLLQLTGTNVDTCGLEITYTYGVNVPQAGRIAARKLADQLILAWSDSDDCELPARTTSISRQGLDITLLDPQDFLNDGRTGVYEVDLFLRAANPDKARKPAKVFSPDLPKAYRVTAGPVPRNWRPTDWGYNPGATSTWSVILTDYDGDILMSGAYVPHGTISDNAGNVLVELDETHFELVGGNLVVTINGTESTTLGGNLGLWDLYGINSTDNTTLVHVLSSTMYPAT